MKDEIDILNEILSIQIRYTKPLVKKDDKDYIIEAYENLAFKMKNLITTLQEENKILKENAELNDKVVDKAKWNEMIYKSRNEKTIEYIKEWQSFPHTNGSTHNELRNLLNILNGGDNK